MKSDLQALLDAPRDDLTFIIDEPEVNGRTISLRYHIDAPLRVTFTEEIVLPDGAHMHDECMHALRLLALAASASYYKALIPATIHVPSGLTDVEREFLQKVIRNGLSEFAYRNNVPHALTPAIVADAYTHAESHEHVPVGTPMKPLVAVGGGKDSIVSIETVRKITPDVVLFSVNEYAPIRRTAERAGLPLMVATRKLDAKLFELNNLGALNGHVAVTAVNSLIACISALALGRDAVIFSNESSASSGNLVWHDVEVNHQWSKGYEFEYMLRSALPAPEYFSLLRPLTELAIARQFAKLTQYHDVFTSCNRAFHLDPSKRQLWCGDCPKCRFVFLSLAPFMPKADLLAIFSGRNLLDDPTQFEGFRDLLNIDDRMKPFECVGEPDECRAAATLVARMADWQDTAFLQLPDVREAFLPDVQIERVFDFNTQHFLPDAYEEALQNALR